MTKERNIHYTIDALREAVTLVPDGNYHEVRSLAQEVIDWANARQADYEAHHAVGSVGNPRT